MSKALTILFAIVALSQTCCGQSIASFKERFVYFKSDEINLRIGPSKKYAIKWVIKSKYEPVLAIAQFEQWTKVRDIDGDEGWVMDSLISNEAQGSIIQSTEGKMPVMYKRPDPSSKKIVRLQPRVRVKVRKCNDKGWCEVSINDFKGWVQRKNLWGI